MPDFTFKKHRKRHRGENVENKDSELNLLDCPEKTDCTVVKNPIKKTIEMGIYPGASISVIKNDKSNPNIIIAVGESRYIVSKNLADKIQVNLKI